MDFEQAYEALEQMRQAGQFDGFSLSYKIGNYGHGKYVEWWLSRLIGGKWQGTPHTSIADAVEYAKANCFPPLPTDEQEDILRCNDSEGQ